MRALVVGFIYFGTFIAIGMAARWWMRRNGVELSDVQRQAGPNRGKRKLFLLGFWRSEE
jgi:hypothetical protein